MRLSRLFPPTLYQAPAEAAEASHRLLLRAGLARPLGAGSWALLPLGQQVRRRIQELGREALAALGGQEIALPALVPPDPWVEAGRGQADGPVGLAFRDMAGRPLLLPRTAEPLLTALLRPDLRSHRLLPLLLYGFRTRFREEAPAGTGPLAARQALVLESFFLQPGAETYSQGLGQLRQAAEWIIARCGLAPRPAEASLDPEGHPAHELVDPTVPGSEHFARCPSCDYTAGLGVARQAKDAPPPEEPLPLEEVLTPGCHTIAELAAFLGVPESRTAKAVFLVSEDRFFFVVVRGDMEVNESKLAYHVGARELRPAQEHEIRALGASPGYASPLGIRRSAPEVGLRQVVVAVDDLVPHCPNLVAGANKEDTHLRNVNAGRDYTADVVADLVAVRPGDPCPHCRAPLEVFDSTALGRVWAPGLRYSEALGATFLDAAGQQRPLWLACAEVEVDRLLAACVEAHHDEAGIRWPVALAPYAIHLLTIGDAPEVLAAAASLHQALQAAGIAVLFDDRNESAGVKFADADLLGMPLRVAVSRRTVQQASAEAKRRGQPREATQMLPLDQIVTWARRELRNAES